ncbi:MAG: hypothetical protein IJQ26_02075, partial [Lachnospiraceae bacterium]|nr:hypothetical protein [Lachnospiraceae bacterium]
MIIEKYSGNSFQIEFTYSAAVNLTGSLHVLSNPQHHPTTADYLMQAYDVMGDDLRNEIRFFGDNYSEWSFISDIYMHIAADNYEKRLSFTESLDLADRILKLYENADPMGVCNRDIVSMFMFLQWRIARMCRMRADAADKAGDTALAMEESEVADSLDAKNAAYSRIRKAMDWVGQQKGMRLTPREGLRIGLERADFRLARTFAQQILASDPYDTRANFAMGMS